MGSEAAPLLAKRRSSRRRVVAAAGALLLCGLALVAGRRPRGRGAVAAGAAAGAGNPASPAGAGNLAAAARFCLAQVAVGDGEIAASRPAFASKAAYAARHGYGFLWYEMADAAGFGAACPAIAHLARRSDPRAGAALCGLRAALDAGCEWTLVLDPRVRVVNWQRKPLFFGGEISATDRA